MTVNIGLGDPNLNRCEDLNVEYNSLNRFTSRGIFVVKETSLLGGNNGLLRGCACIWTGRQVGFLFFIFSECEKLKEHVDVIHRTI